eukprot:3741578-Pyramimonas_sp.AAC.1
MLSVLDQRVERILRAAPPVGSVGCVYLIVVGLSCLIRLECVRLSASEEMVAVFKWDVVRGAVERLKRADEVLVRRA